MRDDFTLPAIAVGAGLLLLLIVVIVIRGRRRRAKQPRFHRVESPLTAVEQTMLTALVEATEPDDAVLAGVPMDDILTPNPDFPRRHRRRLGEELREARFDFVVCTLAEGRPRYAVELDDHAERAAERKARGFALVKACRDAELPLLHWPAVSTPTAETLRKRIDELFAPPADPDPTVFVRPDGRREPILDLPAEDGDDRE